MRREMPDQPRDVIRPLGQRWRDQREDVEAMMHRAIWKTRWKMRSFGR